MSAVPTVFVVDDDGSTRELLAWLMKRHGLAVQAFADARQFLRAYHPGDPGCLLLDLNMPGMSGLDLQRYLKEQGVFLPLVFISGGADVPKAVRAVKEGAIDFIEKPFDYKRVVEVVRECLARDAQSRASRGQRDEMRGRLSQLTLREAQVMDLVVAGRTNREIGEDLAISVKTVEAHRARIMEKFDVDSVAGLVQAVMAARAPS